METGAGHDALESPETLHAIRETDGKRAHAIRKVNVRNYSDRLHGKKSIKPYSTCEKLFRGRLSSAAAGRPTRNTHAVRLNSKMIRSIQRISNVE
jgi:hypothetical protein